MTTANLSLGINTKPAFASLEALKAELKTLASTNYDVNADLLIAKVKSAVEAQPIKVTLSGAASVADLKTQINNAIRDVIQGTRRRIPIDKENLAARVKSGIDMGVRDSKIVLGAGNITVDDKLHEKVGPALSKLLNVKIPITVNEELLLSSITGPVTTALNATHSVGINTPELIAKVRAAVRVGLGGLAAQNAVLSKNPIPGAAGAVVGAPTLPVGNLVSLIDQRLTPAIDRMAAHIGDLSKAPRAPKADMYGPSRSDIFRLMDVHQRSIQSAASKIDPRTVLGLPSREAMQAEGRQIAAQMRAGVIEESLRARSAGRIDPRALIGAPSREAMQAAGREIAAQMRAGVVEEGLRGRSAGRIDPRTLIGAPSREAMQAAGREIAAQMRAGVVEESMKARSAGRIDPRTLLGAPSREAMQAAGREIAAQMRAGVQTEMLKGKSAPKLDPRTLLGIQSESDAKSFSRMLKAGMMDDAAAEKAAASFLPNRQTMENGRRGLAGLTSEVDRNAQALKRAAVSSSIFKGVMNDAHSAARGFAGGLGQIWLTWGSTVPLIAGAALAATLRSVFMVGKDLNYQLKFVSVLSDGAAVSMRDFGNAVRGTMAAPVEAAQAMRALAQNGLDVKQSLTALPTVLNLAVAGEMEFAEAALGATGVMAAFNLSVNELDRVGDVFAKAAAMSNTSVSSMVESMRQASTVADQYGVTLEETAASLAVLAKRNIIGSAAGTAFRNMMSELAAPTDKARRAMTALGLDLYTAENQLKRFPVILEELRNKTALLNEKGRLAFLQDLFDERGAKAVNALLSDYSLLQKMQSELQDNAKGFARSVTEALGETTQGKIKRLFAEFQFSASAAFDQVESSANNFIDTLRLLVSSDEFRNSIKSISSGLIELSRVLTENIGTIYNLLKAWVILRAAFFASTFILEVAGSFKLLSASAVAATTAISTMWRALAGPVGLVVMLGAAFFSLRREVSETEQAMKAKTTAMKLQVEDGERYVETVNKEINALREENRLLEEGVTLINAQRDAKRNLRNSELNEVLISADVNIAKYSQRISQLDAEIKSPKYDFTKDEDVFAVAALQKERGKLAKEMASEMERREVASQKIRIAREADAADEAKAMEIRYGKALQAYRTYEDRAKRAMEQSKGKIKLPLLNWMTDMKGLPIEEIERKVENLTSQLNAKVNSYTPINTGRDKANRTSALADEQQAIRQRMEELRRQQAFQKQLDETRYSSDRFGPHVAAIVAEERERRFNAEAIDEEIRALQRLGQLRAKMAAQTTTEPAELDAVDRAIREQVYNVAKLRQEAEQFTRVAEVKALNAAEKQTDDFIKLLADLGSQADETLDKLYTKGELKLFDPVQAAAHTAYMETHKAYKKAILDLEDKIARQEQGLYSGLSEEALWTAYEAVELDKERLRVLKEIAKERSTQASDLARRLEAQTRTAEYGFQRFWTEYVNTGKQSAEMMYDIMKSSTQKIEDALTEMVMTGKVNFKSLVTSILSDVVRMMTHQMMMKFLKLVGSSFGGGGMDTSPVSSFTNDPYVLPGSFAMGGIMTSAGVVDLQRYASGGVARRPQLALFGEGSMAEAYVPLPDGRSIPVTMRGGAGGEVNQDISINITVQGGQTNAETGQVVSRAVVETMRGIARGEIANSRRPGGVLYQG